MNFGAEKTNLRIVEDVFVGDWIRDSLAPWLLLSEVPVTIGIVIPNGFESYVLIHHPREGNFHGSLETQKSRKTSGVLSRFTATQEDCRHALWDGYGGMQPGNGTFYKSLSFPMS